MGAQATIADSYLKEIVSGDVIEAERKFRDSFSFWPTVKLVGSTNHLPRLLDLSDGFFRRPMILQFNRQFLDGERDPNLKDKLVAELPGILAWAVQGLKNLRKRGYFVIPKSSIDALSNTDRNLIQSECFLMSVCLQIPMVRGCHRKQFMLVMSRGAKWQAIEQKPKSILVNGSLTSALTLNVGIAVTFG